MKKHKDWKKFYIIFKNNKAKDNERDNNCLYLGKL